MSKTSRPIVITLALLASVLLLRGVPLAGAVKYKLTTSVEPVGVGSITPSGGTYSRNNYIEITGGTGGRLSLRSLVRKFVGHREPDALPVR